MIGKDPNRWRGRGKMEDIKLKDIKSEVDYIKSGLDNLVEYLEEFDQMKKSERYIKEAICSLERREESFDRIKRLLREEIE